MPRLLPLLTALALSTAALSTATAQAAPDCKLANALDSRSYATLLGDSSEAGQDNAAYDWAQCHAAALDARLGKLPQLRARIAGLRKQLREMRGIEGELAGIRAGGGTMYGHAVPRSYAPLEEGLSSLATLASTTLGGKASAQYAQNIKEAREMQANYVKTLRAYKPKPDEDYVHYDAKQWNAQVSRYEALGKSVMATLGSRNDAATVVGYSLLTDWVFWADE